MSGQTRSKLLQDATFDYLKNLNLNIPPDPADISYELIESINSKIEFRNAVAAKDDKWRKQQDLEPAQIAIIMAYLYPIIKISLTGDTSDSSYNILAIYQSDGVGQGTYTPDLDVLSNIASMFKFTMSTLEFKEILSVLSRIVDKKIRCHDRDLIAVNNGIFNYKTKELMPFSPDYVFLTKSKVNYNINASNIVIHNDEDNTNWDVESWMTSLSDDEEIIELLWGILGAIVRPHVEWGKSAWLYSDKGNNGKGTLCTLMRNLSGASASININDFSKDFMLEPLITASTIIVDENDVGTYIDKAANLKSIITNDIIMINRKHKSPVSYRFQGFMVQCLNEFPKIRDRSDSLYRRQLFVPMNKHFEGIERKYIKHDYLYRQDVLEYVLYKLLNTNIYELPIPKACQDVLSEYKEYNDPIRQFLSDIEPQLAWDIVPYKFLYELYKKWININIPNSQIIGRNKFAMEIRSLLQALGNWVVPDPKKRFRTKNAMDKPEFLIAEYDLKDYYSKTYNGNDMKKRCQSTSPEFISGFVRKSYWLDNADDFKDENNQL